MTGKDNLLTTKIGLKIKLERVKRNISQEKLAELADLSKNSIGAIERGESTPTIETLDRIARAFDMPLTELVDVSKISLG